MERTTFEVWQGAELLLTLHSEHAALLVYDALRASDPNAYLVVERHADHSRLPRLVRGGGR